MSEPLEVQDAWSVFASVLNELKAEFEERALARYGDVATAEREVRTLLRKFLEAAEGQPEEVVFLAAGSILANILSGYGRPQ